MRAERTFLWKSVQGAARPLCALLFDLKVEGWRNVPARGGVLIVSNHQSYLDPVLISIPLRRPLNYIAKSELFENPLSNGFLRALNAFPVRQGAGDVGAVKETILRLQEGHLLNIYPEGARTLDGRIAPLQKGVALIIRRARVPVVPAVIVGAFEAWPLWRTFPRSWPIQIRYGPPMDLKDQGSEDIIATIDRTLRIMFEQVSQASSGARNHGGAFTGRPMITSQR